ncbi:MAG: SHD1 domain-containing protein [Pontiella sp.]
MNRTLSSFFTLTLLISMQATAEMRTWTDSRGNTIEAELLENMHGEITLLKADGKEAHVSISDLIAKDQTFLLKNSPPKITIHVSEITSRTNKGFSIEHPNNSTYDRDFQVRTTSSHYKVKLEKSGTISYTDPIQAELYVFGYKERDDAYILLSKTIKKFTYGKDEITNEFVFESNPITTRSLQGNQTAGITYYGNMVVLLDKKGNAFTIKGSRSKMHEHTAVIRKMKAGETVMKDELTSAQNTSQ